MTKSIDDFGVITEEMNESTSNFDFRAAIEYCKENKKSTEEMTDSEIKMFTREK